MFFIKKFSLPYSSVISIVFITGNIKEKSCHSVQSELFDFYKNVLPMYDLYVVSF